MLSSDIHCKENDGFKAVSVHPVLVTSDYSVHEVGDTVCGVRHVLGVRVRLGNRIFCHFPYNENPTRAPNTTSLKCSLLSTDAID